ncbi:MULTISPECIES: MucR family transcriptional regulator [Sphingomonas]|uniref:MucR family transcriptional regulator n=1 Tax=Sphingomonas TaxID=13687 RepID=UPI000DEF7D32|nr:MULTISPECIES: MucR family transcriptional regulator [Sphingomonas]
MADDDLRSNAVELATELTIAWLGNPNTRASSEEVPAFLSKMHEAVQSLAADRRTSEHEAAEAAEQFEPATTVRKSLASKDHIISMIDGKPYKTLRRHLSGHGLTPEDYRARYNLKADYPMVAPSYSEARRSMAKQIGLGRKPRSAEGAPAQATATKASRSARKTKKQPQAD